MRLVLLLIALAVAPLPALAQSAAVERIDVVDRGVYAITTGAQSQNANTPTGTITAVTAERLVQPTSTVTARVGLEFGFRYKVVGAPPGAEVSLDIVNTYPAPGLKDPAAAAPMLESRYARTKKIGDTVYLGYGFENDWEIVPGKWTFTISYEGKKLAEESFIVVKP